ncbi:methylmalonyl-CoA epimerase [Propionicicella superfundia]|uniref:methylmalonyl-CoA epimerase n=1 Tax=Propionicicella superfundia TaxID=348582 RepID=UPI00041EF54E|nr:methylmalonyl-CoA epimerase [Propionicicella superfundia]
MENDDLFICIDHVGLAVPSLDDAIEFHTKVMGWRVLHREKNEEQGVEEAMIGTGDQLAENAQIQLLAPLSDESTIAKFIGRNGPGMQQLAYRVRDLDKVMATLKERGVRLLYPEPRRGTAGSRINFCHPKDTGGVLLELVEPAAH